MSARLAHGEATAKELAAPSAIRVLAVPEHLKVLEAAGLVSRSRTTQWRPVQLRAAPLAAADDWIAHYRAFWESSFDALADHLRDLEQKGSTP